MVLRLILVALFLLSNCAFDDPYHPRLSGHFSDHLIGEGEDGPIINPELTGLLNKVEAGRPATVSLIWTFDWPLGHKLPGEK